MSTDQLRLQYDTLQDAITKLNGLAGEAADIGGSIANRATEVNSDTVGDDKVASEFSNGLNNIIQAYQDDKRGLAGSLLQIASALQQLVEQFQQVDAAQFKSAPSAQSPRPGSF